MILLQKLVSHYWAVNLHVIKILRIEREGMIHDVISHDKWRHLCQECSLILINVYSTQTVHISRHYCLNYSSIPEFMRKRSSLTVAQKTQNIWNFMVGKSSLQKEQLWRSSRRDQTLIWRLGDKVQNLEAPGLSGRDDSTALQWVHTLTCPSPVTVIEKLVNANSFK